MEELFEVWYLIKFPLLYMIMSACISGYVILLKSEHDEQPKFSLGGVLNAMLMSFLLMGIIWSGTRAVQTII